MFWVYLALWTVAKVMHHAVVAKGLDPTGRAIYRALERRFNGAWQEPENEVVMQMLSKIYSRTKQMMDTGKIGIIKRADVPTPPDLDILKEDMKTLEDMIRGKGDMAQMRAAQYGGKIEDGEMKKRLMELAQTLKTDDMKAADQLMQNVSAKSEGQSVVSGTLDNQHPTKQDIEEFRQVFEEAAKDPDFKVFVHKPVKVKRTKPKSKPKSKSKKVAKSKGKKK